MTPASPTDARINPNLYINRCRVTRALPGCLSKSRIAVRLNDEYQIVVNPIVLGAGRTLFETVTETLSLRLTKTRSFGNGNLVLWYGPA